MPKRSQVQRVLDRVYPILQELNEKEKISEHAIVAAMLDRAMLYAPWAKGTRPAYITEIIQISLSTLQIVRLLD
jgi:hypothetical protein